MIWGLETCVGSKLNVGKFKIFSTGGATASSRATVSIEDIRVDSLCFVIDERHICIYIFSDPTQS
jgi:hypothetical protein